MEDLVGPCNALLESIEKRCPKFKPSIFMMKYNPKKIEELFTNKLLAKKATTDWISSLSYTHPQVAFTTKVSFSQRTVEIVQITFVNELDFLLSSPERVLLMLLQSSETEINIAVARFMELNGYDIDLAESRSIFNEVYNNIYAIRTIMSNIPGFKVVCGGGNTTLPLADDSTPVIDIFKSLFENDKKKKHSVTKSSKLQLTASDTLEEVMEVEEDEAVVSATPSAGKKKKRRAK